MQQNRKNGKGDEYFCKALYLPAYYIIYAAAYNIFGPCCAHLNRKMER